MTKAILSSTDGQHCWLMLKLSFWVRLCHFEQMHQEQEPWLSFLGWLQYPPSLGLRARALEFSMNICFWLVTRWPAKEDSPLPSLVLKQLPGWECCVAPERFLSSSLYKLYSVQFSSVAQSCLTLCHPMNCSTPGFPVHHQIPEFT